MYMYYRCGTCGKQFKYAVDLIPRFGEKFGNCPVCQTPGVFVKDGARTPDDGDYEEVDE
jgi:DNA-directed RNA polymerase subunit RPC12/RpoP